MPQEQLAECVERIDQLLSKIEALSDVALRQDVQEIVQRLLDFHGAALAKLLNLVQSGNPDSLATLSTLAQNELVSSLLLLHDLHPADLETRVLQGLERARPFLESHGGNVELASLVDGVVYLRLQGNCHGCPSSAATLKSRIEQAIYEAAPDVATIELEDELELPAPTNGFVPLETLTLQ